MWFKYGVYLLSCILLHRVNSQTNLQTCICGIRNQCYQNISFVTDGSGALDIRIVNQPSTVIDGSGQFDIRVVNQGDTGIPTGPPVPPPTITPGQCAAGTELCCTGPGVMGCGLRYNIPLTPTTTPVGGQVRYGAQPWQVAILDLAGNFIAIGALLDASNVVTVAHRVAYGRLPGSIRVRLGEWNIVANVEPYPVQEIIVSRITIHPGYNLTVPLQQSNLQNNVAMLRLATPVVMNNPAINSICLPAATAVFDGQRCIVAGWGRDSFNGSLQTIAREVELPVVPNADCQARLRTVPRLTPFFVLDNVSFMCAGGELGRDACTGDGGAALGCMVNGRYQLAGLVAWGIGCADSNIPGVYVKITSYSAWINSELVRA